MQKFNDDIAKMKKHAKSIKKMNKAGSKVSRDSDKKVLAQEKPDAQSFNFPSLDSSNLLGLDCFQENAQASTAHSAAVTPQPKMMREEEK